MSWAAGGRYWAARYWCSRYWFKTGQDIIPVFDRRHDDQVDRTGTRSQTSRMSGAL